MRIIIIMVLAGMYALESINSEYWERKYRKEEVRLMEAFDEINQLEIMSTAWQVREC